MTVRTRSASSPVRLPLTLAPRWIALGLFLLTVVLRLPFVSQMLNHWDSVNHALALTSFNVAAHRPQPPGYILYIGLARLVNLVVPDAQTALVLVSIVASGLAVAFLFLLGTRMSSPRIGLIAALLLLTCPPFWFDGEVALPYAVEGCAGVILAYLLYRVRNGESYLGPLAAVVFAIAIGMRQWLVIYFAPLALYAFWGTRWRTRLEALAWFGFVCLVWFAPLVWSAGGLEPYFELLRAYNAAFGDQVALSGTGGLSALARNLERIGAFLLYSLNLSVFVIFWVGVQALRRPAVWRSTRVHFLGLWIMPPVIFYILFHMGSPGLIYVFLPALLLGVAFGLNDLFRANQKWFAPAVGVLIAANVLIFFATPPDLFLGRDIRVLNYSSLRRHDTSLRAKVDGIRANFDPASTVIVADDWRFAEYYLPEFSVLFLPPRPTGPAIVVSGFFEAYMKGSRVDMSLVRDLVWFDESSLYKFRGPLPECMSLQNGECLPVLHLPTKGAVTISDNLIEVPASE